MAKHFIIVRGLPGAGKTTLAKHLKEKLHLKHYEADMFFEDDKGEYKFDYKKLGEAHKWCLEKTETALNNGVGVVVSNCFVTRRDMQPYFDLAQRLKMRVRVIECDGNYGSVHNVPESTIEKMKRRWEN